MTGVQLRSNLDGRIRWHQGEIRRIAKQLKNPTRLAGDVPIPDAVLQSEIARAERQIEILTFIREYVIADEVYRLGEFDLRFADLLPEDDLWDCDCFPPGLYSGSTPGKKVSEPH
jgi:hypothetical protein